MVCARELKWGNCQENAREKRARADSGLSMCSTGTAVVRSERNGGGKNSMGYVDEGRSFPPQAVHPIRGGIPPTSDPTHVFATLDRFRLVYTPAYSPMLANPRKAERGLQKVARMAGPARPVAIAKPVAWADDIAPRTSGRVLVRAIWASNGTSAS